MTHALFPVTDVLPYFKQALGFPHYSEDLPHITTIWTLSTISFVTVHTALIKRKPPGAMRLRPRSHKFELPTVKLEFNKRNFIVRSLFQYV